MVWWVGQKSRKQCNAVGFCHTVRSVVRVVLQRLKRLCVLNLSKGGCYAVVIGCISESDFKLDCATGLGYG